MPLVLDAIYLLVLVAAAPWLLLSAWRKGKYRTGWGAKFLGLVPVRLGDAPCIWLHAVSVGEVNLLVPLVAELQRRFPECECVVSATSAAGYALARSRFAGRTVFYCPLDFHWAARRATRRIRPRLLILAELELWPNLVAAAGRSGARVAIVNGRLSERSFRGYRRLRPLLAPVLRQLDLVAAQTPDYARRFAELGVRPGALHVSGSIKFDGAITDRNQPETARLRALAGITAGDRAFLAGSTQEPEERLAVEAFRQLADEFPTLRLILVPRHPERFAAVADLLAASGLAWQRRSDLDSQPANPDARVLLVDRIGELRAWWGVAEIGFVGGSLGTRGGQNMIEPAGYGAAVSFGPNTQNFRDVVALLTAADAAVVVPDGAALSAFVERVLRDPAWGTELGRRAQQVVLAQRGATARTVDLLEPLLGGVVAESPAARAA